MWVWENHDPPLHEECLAYLGAIEESGFKPFSETSLEEVRIQMKHDAINGVACYDFDGERIDREIENIQVYVYKPAQLSENPPILIFFHGGSHVMGSRENADYPCKLLSTAIKGIAVNVEYRLAPEVKFPAMYDDARGVALWVTEHKEELGGTALSQVGVAGDNAGGALAASTAHDVLGMNFQVLIYSQFMPKGDRSLPSYTKYRDGPLMTYEELNFYESLMCNPEDNSHPRNANMERLTYDFLPPALIILAECDPYFDDGLEYAKKLTEADVHNEVVVIKGAIHGFYPLSKNFPILCKIANDKIIEFIMAQVNGP